ncbi:MAG: hypothetical protein IKH59_01110 [Bacteroidaceae bacterium]|nr:hypothetical protein [Bacteroidaceae bacterium]
MKTFILFWNPAISSYKLDDFQRELEELYDEYCNMNWSVWEYEKASAGDRFFMVRCGNGNTGICMSGYFSSDPYQDEDWSGRGRVTYYMDLEPDAMIHPDYRPILPTSDLVKAIPSFDWKGGHSGRLMEEKYAEKLEALWASFLEQHKEMFECRAFRQEIDPQQYITEKNSPICCWLELTEDGKINVYNHSYRIDRTFESLEKAKQEVSASIRQQEKDNREIVFRFRHFGIEHQERVYHLVEQLHTLDIPQKYYRLANEQYREEELMAVLLFCLVKYGNTSLVTLLKQGFPREAVDAVRALLPVEGETEEQHIGRIAGNETATDLKKDMLEIELDIMQLDALSADDVVRLNKALREWKMLNNDREKPTMIQ